METNRVRKQIYIDPDQELLLKRVSSELHLTEAEIIRQAIDQQLYKLRPNRRGQRAWQDECAYIESLIAQGPVGGQRTWTRDELYER